MTKFVNNEPKFKVGDKVVYSRRHDDMADWEKESISKGTLTISRLNRSYENDELIRVNYYVDGLNYVYSEDWLSYAPTDPKFKIGDKVEVTPYSYLKEGSYLIEDILMVCYQKDGHEEYLYRVAGWPFSIPERDLKSKVISDEEQLIHDLEICGGFNGCKGCSRESNGSGLGCDKLELDAAELIKKLQKRVKELEEEKK